MDHLLFPSDTRDLLLALAVAVEVLINVDKDGALET